MMDGELKRAVDNAQRVQEINFFTFNWTDKEKNILCFKISRGINPSSKSTGGHYFSVIVMKTGSIFKIVLIKNGNLCWRVVHVTCCGKSF